MFTDTDSLPCEIKTNDMYEDFCKNKNWFIFSENPQTLKFYDKTNNKRDSENGT